MVCLGNICRSPLGEGILKSKLPIEKFFIDSAGTASYHIGSPPDKRSIEIAKINSIDISDQRARAFKINDFKTFDIIYVLTSGGPGILTRTLNLYAFKHGIEFLSMGYAGSIAIVMLIITIVVAQIFLRKNKLLTPKETLKQ